MSKSIQSIFILLIAWQSTNAKLPSFIKIKTTGPEALRSVLNKQNCFEPSTQKDKTWIIFDFGRVIFPLGGYQEALADNKMLQLIRELTQFNLVGAITQRDGKIPLQKDFLLKEPAKSIQANTVALTNLFAANDALNLFKNHHWYKYGFKDYRCSGYSCFWRGIFFTGTLSSISKGLALQILLQEAGQNSDCLPTKIILIDDDHHHLQSMAQTIKKFFLVRKQKADCVAINYLPKLAVIVERPRYSWHAVTHLLWSHLKRIFSSTPDLLKKEY